MHRSILLPAVLCFSCCLVAQTKSNHPKSLAVPVSYSTGEDPFNSSRLPVKRVVLYKNGVGYFEHTARVHGTQDLSIDFTTAQLNDVLKSLTAVDLGEGQVSSVRYNSIAPLDQRLKSLRLPFGEQITQDEYLAALRGARVEVRSGSRAASGHLLSVEKTRRQKTKDDFEDVTTFSIVTDTGEMKNFELNSATSVRTTERELSSEVQRYLDLIGSSRAPDVRRMSFTAAGEGDRDVFVSYISEVPVWKSTYRILIPRDPSEKPLLQGWAVVDNTIGEDWKDVQLSLVTGAPQSFVQNISQPLYARRPEVPLPKSLLLTPQSHEATEVNGGDQVQVTQKQAAAQQTNGRNFSQLIALAPGVSNQTGQDEGIVANQVAEAQGESLGDYFEYAIHRKITIGKNQSALVPILQAHIEAEKVTLWNPNSAPLLALWIRNTSGEVLDAGSFNVLEAGTFAGEGVLETIHPDERRLLSYAGDAAVHTKHSSELSEKPFSRVQIVKGVMVLTKAQHRTERFSVRNADTSARQVIIESPEEKGWQLAPGTPQPEESTESFHRFRVPVDAGKTAELTVESVYPQQVYYELSNLDASTVELIAQQRRVTASIQQALDDIVRKKMRMSQISEQIDERKHESDQIAADQSRIRENMKALKGAEEEKALLQRYVGQLESQENRLATLRKESSDLTTQQSAARVALDQSIMALHADESF